MFARGRGHASARHSAVLKLDAMCRKHEGDVGSTEVQIARLSGRVRHLTKHLQANRKDHACARGLMGILGQRTHLLKYLYSKDEQAFARVVRELKIRNPIKSVTLKKV